MAKNTIRIKAAMKGGTAQVKALIKHPMETGLRKDKKTGKKIPAHFIKEVKCSHNGSEVFIANWGVAVSRDPFLSFNLRGANSGDSIDISWVDNKGDGDSSSTKVK